MIEQDARGEPTGVFYNHRAIDLLRRYIPQLTPEMARDDIAYAQPVFAANEVTTFHDNNVRGVDTVGAYFDTDWKGKMLIRGQAHHPLECPADLERALKEVEHYKTRLIRGITTIGAVEIPLPLSMQANSQRALDRVQQMGYNRLRKAVPCLPANFTREAKKMKWQNVQQPRS